MFRATLTARKKIKSNEKKKKKTILDDKKTTTFSLDMESGIVGEHMCFKINQAYGH